MNTWQQYPIQTREDGSYIVMHNGHPYHVPNEGGWLDGTEDLQWADIHAWAKTHPKQVEAEPLPPEPSAEEKARAAVEAVQTEYMEVIRQLNSAYIAAERDNMVDTMAAIQADSHALRTEMNASIQAAEARALGLKARRAALTGNIAGIRKRWCSCGREMKDLGGGKLRCPACGYSIYPD